MKRLFAIALLVSLGGCATATCGGSSCVSSTSSNSLASSISSVNADIAALAPDVAVACMALQTAAMLVQPYIANGNSTATASFTAANTAINTYCQAPPTNIAQTVTQLNAAVTAANAAYSNIKAGKAS